MGSACHKNLPFVMDYARSPIWVIHRLACRADGMDFKHERSMIAQPKVPECE